MSPVSTCNKRRKKTTTTVKMSPFEVRLKTKSFIRDERVRNRKISMWWKKNIYFEKLLHRILILVVTHTHTQSVTRKSSLNHQQKFLHITLEQCLPNVFLNGTSPHPQEKQWKNERERMHRKNSAFHTHCALTQIDMMK